MAPWTAAYQAPPSMAFSRQEYWSGVPFPSPGDLPDSGIQPGSPALWPHGLYSPWNSLGQNIGVGSLSLLQGSSQPREQTQVSHIAGRFFTSWATRVFVTFKSNVHVFHKIRRTGVLQGLGLCPGWPNSVKNQGVSGEETIDTPPEHSDLASYQGCGHSSKVV